MKKQLIRYLENANFSHSFKKEGFEKTLKIRAKVFLTAFLAAVFLSSTGCKKDENGDLEIMTGISAGLYSMIGVLQNELSALTGSGCSADPYEPDNKHAQARVLSKNAVEDHNHCDNPVDWYSFNAQEGYIYTIETTKLGIQADTIVCVVEVAEEMSGAQAIVPQACNDDANFESGSLASKLTFTSRSNGLHYFTVESVGGFTGQGTEYTVSLKEALPLDTPDLKITSFTGPDSIHNAQIIKISGSVTNSGSAPSSSFNVGIYLEVIDVQTVLIASELISGLNVGETALFSQEVVADFMGMNLTGLSYRLYAVADDEGAVHEVSESNNYSSDVPGVFADIPLMDITVSLDSAPAQAPARSSIDVAGTVYTSYAVQGLEIEAGVYLSEDADITTADTRLYLTSYFFFEPAGSMSEIRTVRLPDVPPGTYYIGVIADPNQMMDESDETNNTVYQVITITEAVLADLVAPAVWISPDSSPAGSYIYVSGDIQNNGGEIGNVTVRLYLSTDDIIAVDDIFINQLYINVIPANGIVTAEGYIQLPVDIAPGNYYLGMIISNNPYEPESDETNNTSSARAITVTEPLLPDYIVSLDASIYSVQDVNTVYEIPGEFRNIGTGVDANGNYSYVDIYISADNVIDGNDSIVGSCFDWGTGEPYFQPDPGNSISMICNIIIPGNISSGNYYLIAAADEANNVLELDETNNTAPYSISIINPLPDLVITSYITPSAVETGAAGTLSVTVKNTGDADAGISNVDVEIYTVGGEYLATMPLTQVSALSPGQEETILGEISDVTQVPPGDYFIKILADPGNWYYEKDENNNSTPLLPLKVVPAPLPDLTFSIPPDYGAASFASGDPMTVSVTVINSGVESTPSGFRIGLYASQTLPVTNQDTLLCSADIGVLLSGESASPVMNCSANLPVGSYNLSFIIDDQEIVDEPNEANNRSTPGQITVN